MNHTPGPWKAFKRAEPIGFAEYEIHFSDDGECVAEVVHGEADAKLIAAAPDLLEACLRVVEVIKENTSLYNELQSAIQKATI